MSQINTVFTAAEMENFYAFEQQTIKAKNFGLLLEFWKEKRRVFLSRTSERKGH